MRRRPYRAFACLLLTLCACNPQPPKATPGPSSAPTAAATPLALHITGQGTSAQPVRAIFQRAHNRTQYELIASSYESKGAQGQTRAVFQNARVTFHDPNGSTMTANAPQAIVDEKTNTVTLVNGVHAVSGSGMTLSCSQLVYDRTTEMLLGTGNVAIVDPKGFRATGSSFSSDVSLTHMHMK